MRQVFKSKRDAWMMLVMYVSIIICLVASIYVLSKGFSTENILIALLTFLLGCIFPIWLISSLRYVITEHSLEIRCGPFYWKINKDTIKIVESSSDVVSGPALSLDRLLLVYGEGKTVLISPEDKQCFISALALSPAE